MVNGRFPQPSVTSVHPIIPLTRQVSSHRAFVEKMMNVAAQAPI